MELNQTAVSEVAGKLGLAPEVFTKFLLRDTPEAEVTPIADSLKTLEVFTADQLSQRITNERATAATEAERNAKGNTYGAMDKRILADTGIAKNEGEATIDYMARAAKEKYGTKTDESAEMARLRADVAAKDTLLQQKDSKLQEIEVAHATERKQGQINAKLDGAINVLQINVPADQLDGQRGYVKYMLEQKYTIDMVDGKEQFTDKATGQVVRDNKTAAPMTAAALVAEFAPKVVSLKAKSTAQGSGFDSSRNDFNDEAASFDFSKYGSKEEFAKDMAKQGVALDSEKGVKLYKKFKEARPDLK